jgi:hypothetical protein
MICYSLEVLVVINLEDARVIATGKAILDRQMVVWTDFVLYTDSPSSMF